MKTLCQLLSLLALLCFLPPLQGAETPYIIDLRAKAAQGNATAQFNLGICYDNEEG